ncbi:MAG: hypothetical protein V7706_11410 [Dietzia psychralcaliphila]
MTTPSENPESHGGDPDGYGSAYGDQSNPGDPYSPGTQPYGFQSPYGDQFHGDQPYSPGSYGSQPYGNQPYGTQSFENQPFGNQPYGAQPFGNQPYGAQPFGNQPFGEHPYGVQPYVSPGYGAMHPYAPNYGVSRKEPALSLVLSFFLPGLGTLINGETGKGIGIMAGYFLGILLSVVLIGIPIMLGFWVWGMIDGYSGAKAHNLRNGFH